MTQARKDGAALTRQGDPDAGRTFIVNLDRVGADDLASVGGKATNLGELIRAGFPVPPGFVVTTAAYDQVVARNGLARLIARASVDGESATAATRAAFESATIPVDVENEILAAYRRLGGGSVAVRSSATAEDLPEAAFAGQQETFLGVVGETSLLHAVRDCWASLWTDRAIAYRERHGIDGSTVKLAVVVQRMVAAEVAGVLFTANPITGARDETIIDASPGLGEAIVSGLVTPDHFVLRKEHWRWRIVARQIGQREVVIQARAEGGTERIEGTRATTQVLPDCALIGLAQLGTAIEQLFGRPQDAEWAWADDQPSILQARPITALPVPPPARGRIQLPRIDPGELFHMRPYPLDVTTWITAMLAVLPRMLPVRGIFPTPEQLWVEEDGVVVRAADWPTPHLMPRLPFALVRLLVLARCYDPATWQDDPLLARFQARVRELEGRNLQSLTWRDLLTTAKEAMRLPVAVMELRRRYLPRTILAAGALRLLLGILGLADQFSILLTGADNKTLQANAALERLAATIRSNPNLAALVSNHDANELWPVLEQDPAGQELLTDLRAFLDRYGHRETVSATLMSQPTWKDAPGAVLAILKGLALGEPPPRDAQPAWQLARERVLHHMVMSIPPLRAAFLTLLDEARRFLAIREDTHFYLTMPLPTLRRTFLELGRRLTEVGVLDAAEDVFHLRFEELERIGGKWPPPHQVAENLRATVKRRAERRGALTDTPLTEGLPSASAGLFGNALLSGTPGSPGVAQGPVRIVREAAAFGTLQPGEVLVAPYTNPSWTPLFGRATAVVVDTGGAVSHAAIVAREYGIPAVMGTGDGTRKLHDGQLVRVDGTRGLVFPATEPISASDQRQAKTLRRE